MTRYRKAELLDKVEQELIRLSNQWMDAWKRRDRETLARILADDFTLTSSLSTGELVNKQQWLEKALRNYECESFRYDKMKVRIYGNTAVISSKYRQQATADGQDWSWEFLITDVWVKDDGRWQVVARHASRLVKPQPDGKS